MLKISKLIEKIKLLYLMKTDQARLIQELEIDAQRPETIHLYGKVDFGTEPWIISLGDNVHLTDGVKFLTHDGGSLLFRNEIPDLEITKPIRIGNNVYAGNNALFLPGVTVGSNVIVAAGAIVTKDIPSGEVWGGVPARKIETIEEYLEKARQESLHVGHLKGSEKDHELRKIYGKA